MSEAGKFYVVGTPIGNLQEITLRALEVLNEASLILCEDTRRTLKLLNHYEIKKPLKSAPYFKERRMAEELKGYLQRGEKVAFVSDAGVPGLSDPGAAYVAVAREFGFEVEVVGGVSALTSFLSGLGRELNSFRFIGFLPSKRLQRRKLFDVELQEPWIFFESPHRLLTSLEILAEIQPAAEICMAKELSKVSEKFYWGQAGQLLQIIDSFKGEWIGCLFPQDGVKK